MTRVWRGSQCSAGQSARGGATHPAAPRTADSASLLQTPATKPHKYIGEVVAVMSFCQRPGHFLVEIRARYVRRGPLGPTGAAGRAEQADEILLGREPRRRVAASRTACNYIARRIVCDSMPGARRQAAGRPRGPCALRPLRTPPRPASGGLCPRDAKLVGFVSGERHVRGKSTCLPCKVVKLSIVSDYF